MDAIHYKISEDGSILNRAAYVVLGGTLEGNKDILSITIGANESLKFWLGMLNGLKNRGVQEILFFCVDDFLDSVKQLKLFIQMHRPKGVLSYVKEKWGKKYPYAISNWELNWDVISSFFQFSDDIRRIMYTTNIIEGVNRQFRKVTKIKSAIANDTSLEKMLYQACVNIMKK